jgi:hypothetical protein
MQGKKIGLDVIRRGQPPAVGPNVRTAVVQQHLGARIRNPNDLKVLTTAVSRGGSGRVGAQPYGLERTEARPVAVGCDLAGNRNIALFRIVIAVIAAVGSLVFPVAFRIPVAAGRGAVVVVAADAVEQKTLRGIIGGAVETNIELDVVRTQRQSIDRDAQRHKCGRMRLFAAAIVVGTAITTSPALPVASDNDFNAFRFMEVPLDTVFRAADAERVAVSAAYPLVDPTSARRPQTRDSFRAVGVVQDLRRGRTDCVARRTVKRHVAAPTRGTVLVVADADV